MAAGLAQRIRRKPMLVNRQIVHNADLQREVDELKSQTNDRLQVVFEALDQLFAMEERPKRCCQRTSCGVCCEEKEELVRGMELIRAPDKFRFYLKVVTFTEKD